MRRKTNAKFQGTQSAVGVLISYSSLPNISNYKACLRNWLGLRWQRETTTTKDYWEVSESIYIFLNPLRSCPYCTSLINCMSVEPSLISAHPSPVHEIGCVNHEPFINCHAESGQTGCPCSSKSINSSGSGSIFRGLDSTSVTLALSLSVFYLRRGRYYVGCLKVGGDGDSFLSAACSTIQDCACSIPVSYPGIAHLAEIRLGFLWMTFI